MVLLDHWYDEANWLTIWENGISKIVCIYLVLIAFWKSMNASHLIG